MCGVSRHHASCELSGSASVLETHSGQLRSWPDMSTLVHLVAIYLTYECRLDAGGVKRPSTPHVIDLCIIASLARADMT